MNSLLPNNLRELFDGGADQARTFLDSQVTRIVNMLAALYEQQSEILSASEDHYSIYGTESFLVDGTCVVRLKSRVGLPWRVERITTNITAGATGIATVYVGSDAPQDARMVVADADFFTGDCGPGGIQVPGGRELIVKFSGGPLSVNEKATVAVQVAQRDIQEN